MTAPIDCSGQRFGRLVALRETSPKIRKDRGTTIRRYSCQCDCGNSIDVTVPDLRSGNTVSCGCWKIEATKRSNTTHGKSISVSRSGKATTEYHSWRGMIDRCTNERHISYKFYGARGIKVCDRWRSSFEDFLSDMGEKPSKLHSIDRINGDGDYSPDNCRWATGKQQFANQRVSAEFLRHMQKPAALSPNNRVN